MVPTADYVKAVYALDHPAPPAYVSYVTSASAHGIAGDSEPKQTIFVRTKDGAIVAGSIQNFSMQHYHGDDDSNPVSHPIFAPHCYIATNEQPTQWEGRAVVRFLLQPVCPSKDGEDDKDDNLFDTLYADPQTLAPLGVTGTISEEGVSVDLEQHFTRFGSYTYASDISVHVRGHGLLFWVRERGEATYSQYQFYDALPKGLVRRQAAAADR